MVEHPPSKCKVKFKPQYHQKKKKSVNFIYANNTSVKLILLFYVLCTPGKCFTMKLL
jgi:hypothetical protein